MIDPSAARQIKHTHADATTGMPAFQRGNFVTELVRRVNLRELTMREADSLLADYDSDALGLAAQAA